MYLVKSRFRGTGLVDTQSICPVSPSSSLGRRGRGSRYSAWGTARYFVPGGGRGGFSKYTFHWQSLNTCGGQHRSGDA